MPNKIRLITGPMFSGKTSFLVSSYNKYVIGKKKTCVINYSKNQRYCAEQKNVLLTHDLRDLPVTFSVEKLNDIDEDSLKEYSVIIIDEGQFFTDLLSFCQRISNKEIVVAGLSSTFERKPFDSICSLLAEADEVISLKAVCLICGHDAMFSKRKVEDNRQELIGGSEFYEPRCRECWSK